MGQKWEPMFPEISRMPNQGSDTEGQLAESIDDSGNIPWVMAPESSHVHSWRLYDAESPQLRSFMRKFMGGESQLQVRFKATKSRGISQYTYFFKDHAEARDIFDALGRAASPWGEVGRPRLVDARVPYTETV